MAQSEASKGLQPTLFLSADDGFDPGARAQLPVYALQQSVHSALRVPGEPGQFSNRHPGGKVAQPGHLSRCDRLAGLFVGDRSAGKHDRHCGGQDGLAVDGRVHGPSKSDCCDLAVKYRPCPGAYRSYSEPGRFLRQYRDDLLLGRGIPEPTEQIPIPGRGQRE